VVYVAGFVVNVSTVMLLAPDVTVPLENVMVKAVEAAAVIENMACVGVPYVPKVPLVTTPEVDNTAVPAAAP
jgi:hypothetical protein